MCLEEAVFHHLNAIDAALALKVLKKFKMTTADLTEKDGPKVTLMDMYKAHLKRKADDFPSEEDKETSYEEPEKISRNAKKARIAGSDAQKYFDEGKCFNCDDYGHFSRNCPNKVGNQMNCFVCKQPGHLSRDCTQKPCYNCGQKGHVSKQCPKPQTRPCYNCQEVGHIARDCKKPANNGPRQHRNGRGSFRGGFGGAPKRRNFSTGANTEPLGAQS